MYNNTLWFGLDLIKRKEMKESVVISSDDLNLQNIISSTFSFENGIPFARFLIIIAKFSEL